MAVVLFNPTNRLEKKFQESLDGFYMGKKIEVGPGKQIKVQDAAARHLLNELGPRGLMSLDYDDAGKEEERAKEGLERNRAFKVKQLNDFNEKNSARKHRGLEYLWPADHIKLYAKEIGVKLVESYQVDDAQLQKVNALEAENRSLRELLGEMNQKIDQISNYIPKPLGPDTRFGSVEDPSTKPIVEDTATDPILEDPTEDVPLTKDGKVDKRFKGD